MLALWQVAVWQVVTLCYWSVIITKIFMIKITTLGCFLEGKSCQNCKSARVLAGQSCDEGLFSRQLLKDAWKMLSSKSVEYYSIDRN